jgi:tripartite-type tricarboxylate transporter receptor subunit TctC
VVAYLNKQLNETINTSTFKERMGQLGMTVPTDNTPETFAAYMRREIARQADLAKLSGHAPLQR